MIDHRGDGKINRYIIVMEICFAMLLYCLTAFVFMRYVMRRLPHWYWLWDIRGVLAIIAPAIGWYIFNRNSSNKSHTKRILSIVIFTVCTAILSGYFCIMYGGQWGLTE
jgi:Zn-dependent protease